MPDAGDFERDVHQGDAAQGSWGDAFAALAPDAPDAGAWHRVQARLPAPARRGGTRWPVWLATAATLALAAAIPLRLLPHDEPATAATSARSTSPVVASGPAKPASAKVADANSDHMAMPTPTPAGAIAATSPRAPRTAPAQRPVRTAAPPAEATHVAAAEPTPAERLEPLYAQSAQLESLLAMARDDRVANGTTAALSDELAARVAAIDTALVQPDLAEAQRADLWTRRVDALQQLLGIETTNRLYAARGQSYDAALVSID